jgi:hypothetical protein
LVEELTPYLELYVVTPNLELFVVEGVGLATNLELHVIVGLTP